MSDPVAAQYQGERGREYHEGKRSIPAEAVPWVARLRAEKIAPQIRANDTVLEYGAGYGWNLSRLQCKRRLAYDVCEFLETELRGQGLEYVSDLTKVADGSMDVVICHHVLEHLASPLEALGAMKRLLRPNGTLLLFVPYERECRYRRFDPNEPNHHLFSWNVQTLANLTSAAGFSITQTGLGIYGYDRFCAKLAGRLHLGESGFRLLRRIANILLPVLEVRIAAVKRDTKE
jgi:SAM-dependent methyltransferase